MGVYDRKKSGCTKVDNWYGCCAHLVYGLVGEVEALGDEGEVVILLQLLSLSQRDQARLLRQTFTGCNGGIM